jgi:hypothetical protein
MTVFVDKLIQWNRNRVEVIWARNTPRFMLENLITDSSFKNKGPNDMI